MRSDLLGRGGEDLDLDVELDFAVGLGVEEDKRIQKKSLNCLRPNDIHRELFVANAVVIEDRISLLNKVLDLVVRI